MASKALTLSLEPCLPRPKLNGFCNADMQYTSKVGGAAAPMQGERGSLYNGSCLSGSLGLALKDDLEREVADTLRSAWTERKGAVVPSDVDLKLSNDAVRLDATVLYADISDSTELVDGYRDWFAAEIYKSFLRCAAKIITSEGGVITAYDGDRVMAIYVGNSKNTSAVRTGLKINHASKHIIQPAIKRQFPTTSFVLRHTVGIDTSPLFVARAGIRGSNDLVWIGRAANYAAKLCTQSHDWQTWITKSIFDQMDSTVKTTNGQSMWKNWSWTAMNNQIIYSSNWWWGGV